LKLFQAVKLAVDVPHHAPNRAARRTVASAHPPVSLVMVAALRWPGNSQATPLSRRAAVQRRSGGVEASPSRLPRRQADRAHGESEPDKLFLKLVQDKRPPGTGE